MIAHIVKQNPQTQPRGGMASDDLVDIKTTWASLVPPRARSSFGACRTASFAFMRMPAAFILMAGPVSLMLVLKSSVAGIRGGALTFISRLCPRFCEIGGREISWFENVAELL